MTLQLALNTIACASLFWVCGSFLLVGGQAVTLRQLTLQAGQLTAMVGSMACGVAPFKYDAYPSWWTIVLLDGIAIIALATYDERFGIRRQLDHAVFAACAVPFHLRDWWRRSLEQAHRNARKR